MSENELKTAKNLGLDNYIVELDNKYSKKFRTCRIKSQYDIIIDNNISGFVCCQYHLNYLMESYAMLLNAGGIIVTEQRGMLWTSSDLAWSLSAEDLACLASLHGLSLSLICDSVYVLKRKNG